MFVLGMFSWGRERVCVCRTCFHGAERECVCAGHVFMEQRESVCVQDMFSLGRAANYVVEAQHMLLSNSQFTGKFKGEKTCFPIFNVC